MIRFNAIEWDDPADLDGNVQHIAAHGVTPEEVEDVLFAKVATDGRSRTSARLTRTGRTSTGKRIMVVYVIKQTRTFVAIYPITAYEV